jgi:DNA-binding NarL/FixJ family response regulator
VYQRSIVVVEDDPFLRGLLADSLEKANFQVSTAATAADARRVINAVDPDAVVLDIDLGPGPTGLDIGEALLAKSDEIAIVYLTTLADPRFSDRKTAAVHPRAAYLNKHMLEDSQVLVDALEAVLHEADISAFRHDRRADRPLAHLSATQIQVLQLVAQGKTNVQIAQLRGRSLPATESVISRTLVALGIDVNEDINARVAAAREYITQVKAPNIDG